MNTQFNQKLLRCVALFRNVALLVSAVCFAPTAFAAKADHGEPTALALPADPGSQHASAVRTGVLTTRDGLTLRLTTDFGPVNITQLEPGAAPVVRYTARIETDARGRDAQPLLDAYSLKARPTPSGVEITGALPSQAARSANAQFWVQFEIAVPRSYNVEVNTEAGDITTGDIGATASLHTLGGNIKTGRIGASGIRDAAWGRSAAKLETEGGHIQVLDVAGDLTAFTGGGHINVGNIAGDASLRTGGGHIRAGQIGGRAELETVGGNITVARAGNFVSVRTGGGQIDFGEVRGSVHAQTGGGGIRVMYVSGPMDVESSGGSICLTRVSGAVRAETGSGTITAWINPEAGGNANTSVRLDGASQLTSGAGDIVVFLPRNLAANIEAVVGHGGEHRIEADPALALQIAKSPQASGPLRAMAALNGGGPVLKLKTTGGKIKLQYLEAESALWDSMMRDQKARMERDLAMTPVAERTMEWPEPSPAPKPSVQPKVQAVKPSEWPGSWVDRLELRILGGVREDGDNFQKRIISAPRPAYPEIARKAGIEGTVRLQVRLTQDGRIEVQKILEGDTVLADAAIGAVKQWRGKPVMMDGRLVDVISTVSFEFHLR